MFAVVIPSLIIVAPLPRVITEQLVDVLQKTSTISPSVAPSGPTGSGGSGGTGSGGLTAMAAPKHWQR